MRCDFISYLKENNTHAQKESGKNPGTKSKMREGHFQLDRHNKAQTALSHQADVETFNLMAAITVNDRIW